MPPEQELVLALQVAADVAVARVAQAVHVSPRRLIPFT
jgi:hypothetical protein